MIHALMALFGGMIASVLRRSAELQHVDQASQATSPAFEEVTGQDLLSSSPVLDVDSQALAQKDLELAAELVGVFKSWCTIGGDQEKGF